MSRSVVLRSSILKAEIKAFGTLVFKPLKALFNSELPFITSNYFQPTVDECNPKPAEP